MKYFCGKIVKLHQQRCILQSPTRLAYPVESTAYATPPRVTENNYKAHPLSFFGLYIAHTHPKFHAQLIKERTTPCSPTQDPSLTLPTHTMPREVKFFKKNKQDMIAKQHLKKTQELVRMNKICFRAPRRTFYLDEINNMRYGQNDH